MVDSNDELFEHVPECVEVKMAYDFSVIPVLGVVFYWLFYWIARFKIGKEQANNSYWLNKGESRIWPPVGKLLSQIKKRQGELAMFVIIGVILIQLFTPFISEPDMKSRSMPSRTNLETLRSCISMYYARTGTYPSDDLNTLVTARFNEGGREVTYLREIPMELISTKRKESADKNPPNRKVYNKLGTEGGWFYDPVSGKVFINYNRKLDDTWGNHAGENPSRW